MVLPQNIVIVEDEVITQRYLQDILDHVGVTIVGCFDNAQEILDVFKDLNYDLLLLDINIKGSMDGIQLARRILQDKHIPIVFITAHNDEETLDEILELAPYGFIGKPFSSKDVIVTLQIAYKRYLTHSKVHHVKEKEEKSEIVISEKYCYSKQKNILFSKGVVVKLNQKQTLLMNILVEHIDHVVSTNVLIFKIWGDDKIADSALRTLIYSLRKLLPDLPIVSHSKMGYMLKNS